MQKEIVLKRLACATSIRMYWTLLNHHYPVTLLRLPCENHYLFRCQERADWDSHSVDTREGAASRQKWKEQRVHGGGPVEKNYSQKIHRLAVRTTGGCFNRSPHFLTIKTQTMKLFFLSHFHWECNTQLLYIEPELVFNCVQNPSIHSSRYLVHLKERIKRVNSNTECFFYWMTSSKRQKFVRGGCVFCSASWDWMRALDSTQKK